MQHTWWAKRQWGIFHPTRRTDGSLEVVVPHRHSIIPTQDYQKDYGIKQWTCKQLDFPHPSTPALGPTHPHVAYNGYRVPIPRVKQPRRGVDHPPPSSAEVKDRVQLYLYSPSKPSWSVLGWISPSRFILYGATLLGVVSTSQAEPINKYKNINGKLLKSGQLYLRPQTCIKSHSTICSSNSRCLVQSRNAANTSVEESTIYRICEYAGWFVSLRHKYGSVFSVRTVSEFRYTQRVTTPCTLNSQPVLRSLSGHLNTFYWQ